MRNGSVLLLRRRDRSVLRSRNTLVESKRNFINLIRAFSSPFHCEYIQTEARPIVRMIKNRIIVGSARSSMDIKKRKENRGYSI